MIWFEAPLSLLYRDLGALEVLSIHLSIHTRRRACLRQRSSPSRRMQDIGVAAGQ